MPATSEHSPQRFFGLDVLRFVAVTLVLHVHAVHGFELKSLAGAAKNWLDLPLALLPPGSYGVDLFFVLSGFLVAGLLFTEFRERGRMSLGRFFIRRGFKIYPAFWVLLLVTLVLRGLAGEPINWSALGHELVFLQNYLPGLWPHTWSLAVEEHFYLLLIVLFFCLKAVAGHGRSLNVHAIPRVFDVVLLSCMTARVVTWWRLPMTVSDFQHWAIWATHMRIDALGFGMLLAYWWHFRWDEATKARIISRKYLFFIAGGILLSALVQQQMNYVVALLFQSVVAYLGAGGLLLASLALKPTSGGGTLRWLAWLGRHSYSVYLWHFLVLEGLSRILPLRNPAWPAAVGLEVLYHVASWTCGIIAARLIEFPVLRLRDRLFPACQRSG